MHAMSGSTKQLISSFARKPLLYSYFRSSCSWRVRIALNLLNIDYELNFVNVLKKDNLADEYKTKINPFRQVPALKVFLRNNEEHTLIQSLAIIDFLDRDQELLPEDQFERAKALSIAYAIACDIQPLQNNRILGDVERITASGEQRDTWARNAVERGFQAIEGILSRSNSRCYCVGEKVSIADICLVPQVYNAVRFNIPVETQFPTIWKIYKNLNENVEAFRKAHPHVQPDCPPELKA